MILIKFDLILNKIFDKILFIKTIIIYKLLLNFVINIFSYYYYFI